METTLLSIETDFGLGRGVPRQLGKQRSLSRGPAPILAVLALFLGGCALIGPQTDGNELAPSASEIDFGDVTVGNNVSKTVLLTSTAFGRITVTQLQVSTEFKVNAPALPLTLSLGQSLTVTVQWSPSTAGTTLGSLTVAHSGSKGSTLVKLRGRALSANTGKLELAPGSLSFGNVNLGSSNTQNLTLKNTGNASLSVTQVTASGAGFSTPGLTLPFSLAPSQSNTLSVRFAPTSTGGVTGSLAITSNAVVSPVSVPLGGTGVGTSQILASPASLSFGVNVGSSASQLVNITNGGNANLTITQANVSGAGFNTTGLSLPLTVTPGQSSNFSVRFAPTAVGTVNGSVSLVSNAPTTPTLISLTGNATQPTSPSVTSVAVSPTNPSVQMSRTIQFTVTVQGTATDKTVTWTTTAGTINTSGLFTAPPSTGSVTVKATSNADASKWASTAVTVTTLPIPGPIAAFPGAQGAGAVATGGRGGTILRVTNLNNSGPGSLRAALEASGTRIVLCDVGGVVNITSQISITSGNLSFYGQTCPGGGIAIHGNAAAFDPGLVITASNVLIQYLTIRKAGGPIIVGGFNSASNVILDHISVSWGGDENLAIWRYVGTPDGPFNVTISWSILSESFGTNIAIGSATTPNGTGTMTNLDFHHNLMGWSSHRHPHYSNKLFRFVNNLTYNANFRYMQADGGAEADIISNVWKLGPMGAGVREFSGDPNLGLTNGAAGSPSYYFVGNKGPNHTNPDIDGWNDMMWEVEGFNGNYIGPLSTQYRRLNPHPALTFPIAVTHANSLEAAVTATVGNSRRLACDGTWVMRRDAVDTRLINENNNGTGISAPISNESQVGGFPTVANGTPCSDSDHDGMPDVWETAQGLNPNDPSDGPRVAANGYPNLENYLSGNNPIAKVNARLSALYASDQSPSIRLGLAPFQRVSLNPGMAWESNSCTCLAGIECAAAGIQKAALSTLDNNRW